MTVGLRSPLFPGLGRLLPAAPFRPSGPTQIAFSGGQTSALMLRLILDANGGLPPDTVVLFQNTGKEHPRTLDFVQQCAEEWAVPVVWLEYRAEPPNFAIVTHASASRNGEPYAALLARRGYLPTPVMRFCTTELKLRVAERYMRDVLGWNAWTSFVGFRRDEPARVARLFACARPRGTFPSAAPLYAANITLADVEAFWRTAPFRLGLERHHGNCDLCFLKGKAKLLAVLRDRPETAQWWIEQEARAGQTFLGPRYGGGGFAGLRSAVSGDDEGLEVLECGCTE